MTPRVFIGIIGAVLIAAGFIVPAALPITAKDGGYSTSCGTAANQHWNDAHDQDTRNEINGYRTNLLDQCADHARTWRIGSWVVVGVGVLVLVGAVAVRSKP